MVAEDFLRVRQRLDGVEPTWTLLTFDSCRHCVWSDATAITRTADRLMTLIWSSALSLFWKALRHNPSALTQPPIPVARSPPQVATSAAALRTASDGRHRQGNREPSGTTGQGQATAEALQRAASDRPPGHRASRQRTDGRAAGRHYESVFSPLVLSDTGRDFGPHQRPSHRLGGSGHNGGHPRRNPLF